MPNQQICFIQEEKYREAIDPDKMSLANLGTFPTSKFLIKGALVRFVGTVSQLAQVLKDYKQRSK